MQQKKKNKRIRKRSEPKKRVGLGGNKPREENSKRNMLKPGKGKRKLTEAETRTLEKR